MKGINVKEFDLPTLKKLTDKAIEPYLISIEQALQSPLSQNLTREQQAQMVEQMFTRSLRLVNFAFFKEVNSYVDTLIQADIEKEKKAQVKQEKSSTKTTSTTAVSNKKLTLKELRERRAERSKAKRGEAERRNKTNEE